MSVFDPGVRKLTVFATNKSFDETKVIDKLNDPDAAVTHIKPEMLDGDFEEIDKVKIVTEKKHVPKRDISKRRKYFSSKVALTKSPPGKGSDSSASKSSPRKTSPVKVAPKN